MWSDGADGAPGDRYGHTACYHAATDSLLAFGGYGGEMTTYDDLWRFDFGTIMLIYGIYTAQCSAWTIDELLCA